MVWIAIRRKSARRAAILLAAALPALPAVSDVRSWDLAASTGQWSTPASWTNSQPPVAGDEIHLNSAGSDPFAGIFDLSPAPQFGDLFVQDQASTGTGEFKLTIADPALTLKVQNLFIGDSSTGRIVQSLKTAQP